MPFWKAGKNDDQVLDELKETQKQNADEFVKKQELILSKQVQVFQQEEQRLKM